MKSFKDWTRTDRTGPMRWSAANDTLLQIKAVKEVKTRLLSSFVLSEKEAEELALGAVKEVCDGSFVVDVYEKKESQVVSAALQKINEWNTPIKELAENSVSEIDLEEALHFIEALNFSGSPKQIAWAQSIANQKLEIVAEALKQGKKIPASAKWWIENRENISF